jgi:tetratricopeptide (TPR) repeat protein
LRSGQSYSAGDVEKLLRLPRRTLRALVTAGYVTPARGPRNAWQFSFQDLILLRTAQALVTAKVPQRRITQSLKALRVRLPQSMPLSGLRIRAEGDRVVVSEGAGRWQADSGQYLLAFEGDPAAGALGVIESAPDETAEAEDWYERAVQLERRDAVAAQRAYERAIAAEPERTDARINLGRLLHQNGRLAQAERVYRDGLEIDLTDAMLHFNLGVLLEDMKRKPEAVKAYEGAVRADPDMADAHYNLALLYEATGRPKDALRHMARYRAARRRP